MLLSSILGTIFAILFPLIKCGTLVLILLKILLGNVMAYIAFKPKTYKKLIGLFGVFFGLTFSLGGVIFAVFEAFDVDVYNFVLFSSSAAFPISLFILCVFVFALACCKFVKFLFGAIKKNAGKFRARIARGGKGFEINAFFDSGNLLEDNKTALPVCVISSFAFFKIYKEISMIDLVLKKQITLRDAHYIKFKTISGGEKEMLVFRPDSMEIFVRGKWERKEIMLGVSMVNFAKKADFDLLLNAKCEVI